MSTTVLLRVTPKEATTTGNRQPGGWQPPPGSGRYQADDDDVDGLLHLFASKLAQDADVAAVALAAGSITMNHDGAEHLRYLPRDVIATRLADMRRGEYPQESDISALEALARLMTVPLFESFATRVRHETSWWSYDSGFINPLPPWEAPRR